jgi:hypothetical protein
VSNLGVTEISGLAVRDHHSSCAEEDGPPWARRIDLIALCKALTSEGVDSTSTQAFGSVQLQFPGSVSLSPSQSLSVEPVNPIGGAPEHIATLPQSPPSSPPSRAQQAASLKQELATIDHQIRTMQSRRQRIFDDLKTLLPQESRLRPRRRNTIVSALDDSAEVSEATPIHKKSIRKRKATEDEVDAEPSRSPKRSKP